jgi:hypothetical protein
MATVMANRIQDEVSFICPQVVASGLRTKDPVPSEPANFEKIGAAATSTHKQGPSSLFRLRLLESASPAPHKKVNPLIFHPIQSMPIILTSVCMQLTGFGAHSLYEQILRLQPFRPHCLVSLLPGSHSRAQRSICCLLPGPWCLPFRSLKASGMPPVRAGKEK